MQNSQLQQAEVELLQALEQEQILNQRIEEMATIEERNRIARDIHDSLGHSLVALNIQMETAITLWQQDPNQAYTLLVEAKQLGSLALQAVRQSVAQMRFDPLQGQTLEQVLAALSQKFYYTTGILPKCCIDLSQPLSHHLSTVLYRIIQEWLTNICKYAEATAVKIHIQTTQSDLLLVLEDNGKGFRVDESQIGYGLQGMQERTAALEGNLKIASKPGAGCRITARFPRQAK